MLVVFTGLLIGCGSSNLPALGDDLRDMTADTGTIRYAYTDSSIPPEGHRSYRLLIKNGEANLVVDSYGTVLHDVSIPVDDDDFAEVLDNALSIPRKQISCGEPGAALLHS